MWLSGKESTCSVGDAGSIPGLGRSLRGGHSNPLQYSCLGSPLDRGAWQAIVYGVPRVGHNLVTYHHRLIFLKIELQLIYNIVLISAVERIVFQTPSYPCPDPALSPFCSSYLFLFPIYFFLHYFKTNSISLSFHL